MHPRTKNYAANGVIIETLQFMGCAFSVQLFVVLANFHGRKFIGIALIASFVNWNQDKYFCFYYIAMDLSTFRALRLPVDLQLMRFDDRRS